LSTLGGRRAGTRELIGATREAHPDRLVIRMSNLATRILFDADNRAIGVECWEGEHLYRADPNASAGDHEVKEYYCAREVNGSALGIVRRSGARQTDPDLFIFAVPGRFEGYYPGYSRESVRKKNLLTWTILKAHTQNRGGFVRLRTADPRDTPEINFKYFDE